jgi:myo-inositol 2-dehydrogenase/D-chiro-inositol 1-dehydrogenase
MGFQRRFDPGFRAAAELVACGGLGRLYVLRTNTNDPRPPAPEYVANCGGLFVDTLIHDFDLVRYVSGREVVEVSAHGQVLVDDMFARYDDVDTAAVVLQLAGGGIAVATASRHDPVGHDVRLEVLGSRDSVTAGVDTRTPWRMLPDDGPPPDRPYTDFFDRFEHAYRDELDAFVTVARDGRLSPCTVGDALAAQRIAAACDRSWRERRTVPIDEVV